MIIPVIPGAFFAENCPHHQLFKNELGDRDDVWMIEDSPEHFCTEESSVRRSLPYGRVFRTEDSSVRKSHPHGRVFPTRVVGKEKCCGCVGIEYTQWFLNRWFLKTPPPL